MTAKLFSTDEYKEYEKFECPSCNIKGKVDVNTDELISDETDCKYTSWSELTEEQICEYCYESDHDHASTIKKFSSEEGIETVVFGDYVAYDLTYGGIPDWFEKYFDKREWKSTDAWRGYYETTFKNGFVKIANGWVTGSPDSTVSHKLKANELAEFLNEEDNARSLPAPLYWLFEPTSNVFSTASEIFCDKEDLPAIKEWLEENGFSEIDEAFR